AAAGKSDLITANTTLPLPRSLWADPHHHGVLCTVKNALLYASIDGGHAWTLVSSLNDGTKWIAIGSVSFDPSRSGVLYASTDAGIFRSLDGGATWSLFDALANAVITVAPSRSATLYRAGLGLARSDDGGATWTQLAMPSGIVTVDPFSDRSVWVFSDRNLYHSADGGATWALEASFAATITAVVIDRDGTHIHVALNPDVPPSELDATIRSERRRSMLSP
ncbi:MAG TPA: hypothetical protein VG323_15760, partial [Thermoanaerobaculia bacterium]|nr:hypothetical protein [Thermoanaerobaculia bacterium]